MVAYQCIFVESGNQIATIHEDGELDTYDDLYGNNIVLFSGDDGAVLDGAEIAYGEIFYLRLHITGSTYLYSQPLLRIPQADESKFASVRYRCEEDAFGFPFTTTAGGEEEYAFASAYLPIRLHSPQNVQEDKTYVKTNGEVVTLYAKYYKEWELETEFLSAEMHDKIIAALSCDYLYINGKRVTKSDNYQIDWDNYDIDCDGTTKIAKATCKVRENITNRNSNY